MQYIRDKAERTIRDKRALLLIGSQSSSAHGGRNNRWNDRVKSQERHMQFCAKLYDMQNDQGLYFIHEEEGDNKREKSEPEIRLEEDWKVYKLIGNHKKGEPSRTYMTNGRILADKITKRKREDLGGAHILCLKGPNENGWEND